MKTPELRHGAFIVNFEHILHIFLVFYVASLIYQSWVLKLVFLDIVNFFIVTSRCKSAFNIQKIITHRNMSSGNSNHYS